MQTIMKNIIRIVSTMLLAAAAALPVTAQQIMDGEAEIRDLDVNDDGKTVTVNMTLDVTTLEVGGDETLILTPVIEGNGHRVELPAIEIMGRRAYIHSCVATNRPYRRMPFTPTVRHGARSVLRESSSYPIRPLSPARSGCVTPRSEYARRVADVTIRPLLWAHRLWL